jgi:hypothetical protein
MNLAKAFNELQARLDRSPTMREVLRWPEWQRLRLEVSGAARAEQPGIARGEKRVDNALGKV